MRGIFDGRRILVTGAASGIGLALSERLTDLGADAIGVDRQASEGVLGCDLTDAVAIDTLSESLPDTLDGIAHVAGLPGTAPVAAILRVNVLAVRRLTAAVESRLTTPSSIVVVSSITAHRCDWSSDRVARALRRPEAELEAEAAALDGPGVYALSKRLLNAWVDDEAARLLGRGVRVNAVSPGPVETPILEDFAESMGRDRIQAAADTVGRHGAPGEIAAALVFLLSAESSWVNGANLPCDGGFSAARRAAAARGAS